MSLTIRDPGFIACSSEGGWFVVMVGEDSSIPRRFRVKTLYNV